MVNDVEMIKKMRLFGLNTYEAKIWAALLSGSVSTAGELSDIANVPRSRSYDVLQSLGKKGFVIGKAGKPIKYSPIPPKEVLENIKIKIRKEGDKNLKLMASNEFCGVINHLQGTYEKNKNGNENTVAILRGKKNIYRHMGFLLRNSKRPLISQKGMVEQDRTWVLGGNVARKNPIGIRVCLTEDDVMIFPLKETEIHPDYDLCIWLKNQQIAKFFKEILHTA